MLEIEERLDRGATVVAVAGELDLVTAPRLVTCARDALRGSPRSMCIDLTDVVFADSAGLACLVNVQRSCDRRSIPVVFVCGEGAVRRLLELSAVERVLRVCDDRAGAFCALVEGAASRRSDDESRGALRAEV